MSRCHFCAQLVADDDETAYREVTSWVHGPKLDGPILREQTGRVAHKVCVEKVAHGQAPDQPELFGPEETGTDDAVMPDWFANSGPCKNCGTSMKDCSNPETRRVCCGKCEHPIQSE